MILTLVTGNPGKAQEIKDWLDLPSFVEVIHHDYNPSEIQDLSLETVARHKAMEVAPQCASPFILEDTGIFFEAYHDFPGSYTKDIFKMLGYAGLLKLTEQDNRAYFKTVIAYMDSTLTEPKFFSAITKGTISREVDIKAKPGLPYDNIFVPEGYTVPNCRLSESELKTVKQRGKALRLFSEFFHEYGQTIK